jgi:hypothetical protein
MTVEENKQLATRLISAMARGEFAVLEFARQLGLAP